MKHLESVAGGAIGSSAPHAQVREQDRMPADGAAASNGRLRATPLPGWPQRILHGIAIVAGWSLFVWAWHEVIGQPWNTHALEWLILGSLVVLPAVSFAWIVHNLGIYRRKGPRTGMRKVDDSYLHDWNGRPIHADFTALRGARIVVIELQGQGKVYRATACDPVPLIEVHAHALLRNAIDDAANSDPGESAAAA